MRDFVVDYYLNFFAYISISLVQNYKAWTNVSGLEIDGDTHCQLSIYGFVGGLVFFFERIIYYHLTEPLARYLYILSRGRHSDLTGLKNFIFKFQSSTFIIQKRIFSSLCFMKLISLFILIFITIPKLVFVALICENFENEFGSLWAIA